MLQGNSARPRLAIIDEFDSISQDFSNIEMQQCLLVGYRDLVLLSGNAFVPQCLVDLGVKDSFVIGQQALMHGRPPSD
jgi:hypothetical protein